MQFSCESNVLAKGINTVKRAISSSSQAPIFSGIHILLRQNALYLIAMDSSFAMQMHLEVNGQEDGEILVPAKAIGDLLAKFDKDEPLTLTKERDTRELILEASKARGTYHIPLMDAEEYPAFKDIKYQHELVLEEETIRQLIETTVYACSTDQNRPLYTGVFIEKTEHSLTAVGTNTHRLAIQELPWNNGEADGQFSMLIPSRVLKEISSNLTGDLPEPVSVKASDKQIQVALGGLTMIASLIEGHFPDYKRPIPPSFANKTVFTCQDMEKAIARVALFSQSDYNIVRLHITENSIVLSSAISDLGNGREEIPCTTVGSALPLNIAFNATYLTDFFRNVGTEQVSLETNTSLSPAKMMPQEENSGYTYIVTPVRVVF